MDVSFDRAKKLGQVKTPAKGAFVFSTGIRFLLMLYLAALVAVSGFAAPFAQRIPFTQPDGTAIELWGEGDEFYAVFETLDGYTVVFDPATKTYHYAQLSPDGSSLVSTGAMAGRDNPAVLGLAKHTRITPDAVKTQVQQRLQRWEQGMNISQRWAGLKAAQRLAAMNPNGDIVMAPPSSATTGTKVGLTLLVDFSDDVATIPQTNINNYCNADNYTGYGNNGSVKQYFWEMSNGALTYSNVVTVYVRAPQPKSYYNDTSKDAGGQANILIRDVIGVLTNMPNYQTEILPQLDALTVDSSTNAVACNVFYAGGNGGVWSYGLWPHSWSLYNVGAQQISPDGKKVWRYQISNIGTSLALGTFCHENGHMLCGFPDIYDYGYDSVGGAGAFCLMDSGGGGTNPVQICAYLKRAAGWATTTELTPSMAGTITVGSSSEEFNHFYRYTRPGVSTEYFLIENRQKSGRDANIPASGIAIWHCDELGNKDNQSLTPNSSHLNYEVTLVQADNLWHFERNSNSGDTKDLYYAGNTATGYMNEFTDYSAPSARWWDGSLSGVRMKSFSASSSTMTVAIGETTSTGNGGTTVITGTLTNAAGFYALGTNGSFNTLVITNGGVLTVTNGGAILTTNSIYVMSLLGDGIIGGSSVASNNSAFVTGAGSLWSNAAALYVGAFGSSNNLSVANSGRVVNTAGYIGYDSAAANNSVQVVGPGSVWSNTSSLYVGYLGSTNSLTIAGGARVFNGFGNIGNSTGASDNLVVVTDAGSVWSNGNNLMIGNQGVRSTLIVTNGGRVLDGGGNIGWAANSTSNLVLVAGFGSVWSNSGSAYVGVSGYGNSLIIANTGRVNNTTGYIGYNATASNNAVLVTDAGSLWSNSSSLYVGNSGGSNSMVIAKGGWVVNTSGYMGNSVGASNNSVWVTDAGSLWSNSSTLSIGQFSAGNSLTITNSGRVINAGGYIGNNSSASNNSVWVTDAGSIWSNNGTLYVGYNGPSNLLTVANTGRVVSLTGYVGYGATASNNTAVVTGAGSSWSNAASLIIGNSGSSNLLMVADGGQVISGLRYIGYNATASNNAVRITGADSVWTNTDSINGTLYVGYYGPSNSLTVADGGRVFSVNGTVGGQTGSMNNTVLVTDTGSLWANTGTINLGSAAGLNRMTISAGGAVMTPTGIVGNAAASTNNSVLVTDFNSIWSGVSLTIGGSGVGNSLVVSNTGVVTVASSFSLGAGTGASNNSVLVTDPGSVLNAGTNLYVGNVGSSNRLTVANSGAVFGIAAYVGYNTGSGSNAVLVTGVGSVWSNASALSIGRGAGGNIVTLADGGTIYASVLSNYNGSIFSISGGNAYFPRVTNAGSILQTGGLFDPDFFNNAGLLQITNGTNIATVFLNQATGTVLHTGGQQDVNYATNFGLWTIATGAVANLTNFINTASGQLVGSGGTLNGSVLNSGAFNFGNSPNTFTVSGDMTLFSSATTMMDLNGTNAGLVDHLTLGGQFTADGVLTVSLLSGYTPQHGDVFDLLDYGSVAGGFSQINLPGGWAWNWDLGHLLAAPSDPLSGSIVFNLLSGSGVTNLVDGVVTNTAGVYTLGDSTSWNWLIVTNSGVLMDTSGIVGNQLAAGFNTVVVTGPGSLWSNENAFYMGLASTDNRLIITNGGAVLAAESYVGRDASASSNTVFVGGAGSVWSNSGVLTIGGGASGNSVNLSDDGTIYASVLSNASGSIFSMAGGTSVFTRVANAGVIIQTGGGQNVNDASNFGSWLLAGGVANLTNLVIDGGGVLTNASGTLISTNTRRLGGIVVNSGTLTFNGGGITADRLIVTNNSSTATNSVFSFNAGTLTTRGGSLIVAPNSNNFVIGSTPGQTAIWNVLGGTSFVGQVAGSTNNTVLGGAVGAAGIVNVSGSGSLWTNAYDLWIGGNGGGNQLNIGSGARAANSNAFVGYTVTANNNSVLVTGSGSLWNVGSNLYFGYYGSNNTLTIANSGRVFNSWVYVGYTNSANNNTVLVTDPGSLWSNNRPIYLGYSGPSNRLIVSNGGLVSAGQLTIGNAASSSNNSVLVTGTNSSLLLLPGGGITVGPGGNNSLTIANGAFVSNGFTVVGAGSAGNAVLITGTSSTWMVSGQLNVGNGGTNSSVTVNNGGRLLTPANAFVYIGFSYSDNRIVITDPGSYWSNASPLFVGSFSSRNSLTISNGGVAVSLRAAVLGSANGDNGNSMVVTGSGSLWSNSNALIVGSNGYANSLVVANGAQAFAATGIVGYASNNNSVLVTGTNSLWNNAGPLTVGYSGSSNSLVVASGGVVMSTNVVVGFNTTSTNNLVTLSGGSLYATNSAQTGVFDIRRGSVVLNGGSLVADQLIVTNTVAGASNAIFSFNAGALTTRGGTVVMPFGSNLFIGTTPGQTATWNVLGGTNLVQQLAGSTSNTLLGGVGGVVSGVNVSGAGTVWSNSANLWVGGISAGNQLTVSSGACAISSNSYLGFSATSSNNTALVTDFGSMWSNLSLTIGGNGAGNSLTIANTGVVTAVSFSSLGVGGGATNNSVLVTDLGSVWNAGSNLYIGSSSSGNRLTVANGGRVVDGVIWSAHGYIGYSANASNNTVLVTDASSVWTNNGDVYVGYSGNGNNLTIAAGGTVLNNYGYIGYGSASSNNSALVTGPGSLWSNAGGSVFYVGMYGSGNRLTISNSGRVASYSGFIGLANSASNNSVVVTGAGSVWDNDSTLLSVGNFGSGNRLTVTNGGWVIDSQGVVGNFAVASNNSVLVADIGSLWSNSSHLFIGASGAFNSLTIVGGGQVFNVNATVGSAISSSNNTVVVSGAGSLWSNSGTVFIGLTGAVNQLLVTNSGRVTTVGGVTISGAAGSLSNSILMDGAGTLLRVGTELHVGSTGSFNSMIVGNSATGIVGGNIQVGSASSSSNNILTITDGGSLLSSTSEVWVGNSGVSNAMRILNGATVTNSSWVQVGRNSSGRYNTLLVSGAGSLLSNAANGILVGNGGLGNLAVFTNSASVVTPLLALGWGAASVSNTVAVVGTGTSLRATGSGITVGTNSAFNTMRIAAGAAVTNGGRLVVGGSAGATGNFMLVTDSGTRMSNMGEIRVGDYASLNTMVITNGAVLVCASNAHIGAVAGANSNFVLVAGAGSVWTNSGTLYVGNNGAANSLGVVNGGEVYDNTAYIGNNSTAGNSSMLVTGTGSVWSSAADFYVGNVASSNRLTVADGGRVRSTIPWIGFDVTSSNNLVLVTGMGAVLSNSIGMNLGFYGSSNRVSVIGGGQLFSGFAHVAYNATASNNSILISDPGSVWSNSSAVEIGLNGSRNSLTIANSGRVFGTSAWIGKSTSAFYNTALVTGTGSLWRNSGYLYIGDTGSLNSLTISSGGQVISQTGNVGNVAASASNSVLVTDAGSFWSNSSGFYIGNAGSSNRLTITNSGRVLSSNSFIGASATASNNSVIVTGIGSIWNNSGFLAVGGSGFNNSLTITNGGQVFSGNGYVGSNGANNLAVVTGTGSVWSNAASFYIGSSGSWSRLVVSDSGSVLATNFVVGAAATSTSNWVLVSGGNLFVTNGTATAALDIRRGTLNLSSGSITANRLYVTNNTLIGSAATNSSFFRFDAGTLTTLSGSRVVVPHGSNLVIGATSGQTATWNIFGGTNTISHNVDDVYDRYTLIGSVTGGVGVVSVTGAGTVWSNSHTLRIGNVSAGNQLNITDGARVGNGGSTVGYSADADNNSVLISGPGSVWSNRSYYVYNSVIWYGGMSVGNYGSSNSVTVSDGGTFWAGCNGVIIGAQTGSVDNSILVDGGFLWVTNYPIASGGVLDVRRGSFTLNSGTATVNRLVSTNGASSVVNLNGGTLNAIGTLISNGNAFVVGGAHTGATMNLVGSRHVFIDGLIVGNSGASNQVRIGGGIVEAPRLWVGALEGAESNAVVLADGLLTVSDGAGGGLFDVLRGSFTLNSGTAVVDRLLATNGASSIVNFNGGRLDVAAMTVSNGLTLAVGDGARSATLNLLGGSHSFANGLRVFSNSVLAGAGTMLVGGVTTTNFGTISVGVLDRVPGGLTNVGDLVEAAGSVLEIGAGRKDGLDCGFLRVLGGVSLDGRLDVALRPYYLDGGGLISSTDVFTVLTANSPLVGAFANVASGARLDSVEQIGSFLVSYSDNNIVLSGFQSGLELGLLTVTNLYTTNTLLAGDLAPGNGLIVMNGGVLESALGVLGRAGSSSNNWALVTGSGSIWSNAGSLRIGNFGPGNQMTISGSGMVCSAEGVIGWGNSSFNNTVTVTDSGSIWTNTDSLYVGYGGSLNQLVINGAFVGNRTGYVGYTSSANSNLAVVSGAGSVWSNYHDLHVGYSGSFNQLTITSAGRVVSQTGYVGFADGANSNTVLVSGVGSVWSNYGNVYVGYSGSANQMTATNGGWVLNGFNNSYVGYTSNANNNAALISGSGSIWSNRYDLYIGNAGSGNQVAVNNGGLLVNRYGYIGYTAGADNNAVLLTGAGSVWTNSGDIYVGSFGSGNQLVIADGAVALGNDGFLGDDAISSNNSVLVTGPGSTWSQTGYLYVGDSGFSNTLTIANSGLVMNARGHVGNNASASNNAVIVTGAGSVWSNSENLYLGNNAPGNSLTVSDGGQVFNVRGHIGNYGTSSNNTVIVTGAGSVWSNSENLYVGNYGPSNNVVIASGGQLFNVNGYVGNNSTSSNNTVLISGTGSLWSNSATFYVGVYGPGNSLTVQDGASLASTDAKIGYRTSGFSNTVLVTGSNSTWDNANGLNMGDSSSDNTLTVSNGGSVRTAYARLGYAASSSNNLVVVANGSLTVTNAARNGDLDIRRGILTLNGGTVIADIFYATNNTASTTNSVFNFNAGTLTTRSGAQIVMPAGSNLFIGVTPGQTTTWNISGGTNVVSWQGNIGDTLLGAAAGATSIVNVIGPGTIWSNYNSEIKLGAASGGNQLVVSSGAQVSSSNGFVGASAGAENNSVSVTGVGSVWSNTYYLVVGHAGAATALTIADGARVFDSMGYIGNLASSSNNSVLLTGTGSLWQTSELDLGWSGSSNSLTISAGGRMVSGTALFANGSVSMNNVALVTDVGSLWSNSAMLAIGDSGSNNRFQIANGATVVSLDSFIGNESSSSNNMAWVTGNGSLWTSASHLVVGHAGSGNALVVSNGARATTPLGYIGNLVSSSNNSTWVMGTGSLWSVSELDVGWNGSSNLLAILDGGTMSSATGIVGAASTSSNNLLIASGVGALWSNASRAIIGHSGSGNGLLVTNGGAVVAPFVHVGNNAQSSNNSVWVTGGGAYLNAAVELAIGRSGSWNSLTVAGTGRVFSQTGYVGNMAGANNNAVLVTGNGSVWSNTSDIYIGNSGSGNSLTVANGGLVTNYNAYLGYNAGANSNAALVTGAGSIWSNGFTVTVGRSGSMNSLTITNGGGVFSLHGSIGTYQGATGNWAVVAGSGSLWSNYQELYVGRYGSNNNLTIAGGAWALSGDGAVGLAAGNGGNAALVTGAGSVWSNRSLLQVGRAGSNNSLTISDGGRVFNTWGYVGGLDGGSNNSATVTGSGSLWNNAGDLFVGATGTFNRLIVTNGGWVVDTNAFVGFNARASNNSVLVSGTGSVWTNAGALTVGVGPGNNVTVADGGRVYASQVTNAGSWLVSNAGLLEVQSSLTIGAAAGLTNRDGGVVRLVSNATLSLSGSLVVTNATLEFAGASIRTSPFLLGVTFQNGAGVTWSGYGGSVGDHAITGNLSLDLPTGPGLARGVVDNARLVVGGGNGLVFAGSNSLVSLTLTNGAQLLDRLAYIAFDAAASNSSALVSGPGSVWSSSESLFVGYQGSLAALTLTDGGTVSATNIVIGFDAASTGNVITVNGGRLVATNATGGGALNVRFGALTFNSGTVTVDRLLLTNGVNSVFNFNGGVLNATEMLSAQPVTVNGGTLALADSFVNQPANTFQLNSGSVLVPNVGVNLGTFIQNGGLFDPAVFTNSGPWTLTGGTNVDGVFLNLAAGSVFQSGGEHDVNVATNFGVWTIAGGVANLTNLFIESGGVFTNAGGALVTTNAAGSGTMDVRSGSFVINSGTVMVNQLLATNFASSVVNFNGGVLNSGGSMLNNGSIFQVGDGSSAATLHLDGGTHSFANNLFINANATLSGTGAITGVITNAGTIAPGDSAGILTGSSSLTLLGGSLLAMQLAGTNAWLYDQINLSGALNFGGTLTLSLLDGFTVSAGNRFDLFDFSGSSGAFNSTNLPGLDPLMYWDTSALYSTGEIEADWMTGALQVTLTPAAALSAGAQWQVDGGAWQNSGDTVTNLLIGGHTLAFKDVAGWIKPTNRVVQVAFGETTVTNGGYELTPTLLAAASRKVHGAAGTFDLSLNLDSALNPTVEPRLRGPTQILFTFNKAMAATDGVLSANEFTLTNATFVSASLASSNLTLNLTNVVDSSKVTVVLNGFSDLAGNSLTGTNAVKVRALYGDANQNGSVTIGDMQTAKNRLGQPLTTTNYLADLNLTGTITIGDMQVAKNNLAHTVPLGDLNLGGSLAPASLPGSASAVPAPVIYPASLGEALGAPELPWSTNGDEVWQPTLAPDGSAAACSGSIGDLNVSWVETTVMGPGTVTFQWKTSSEANADCLTFSVDGVEQPGSISGEMGWQELTFSIPPGTHRLTWTYAKNQANTAGLDTAWLRRVVFQRSP